MKKILALSLLSIIVLTASSTVFKKTEMSGRAGKYVLETLDTLRTKSCGTRQRDPSQFVRLPYYNNNQYLEHFLDSIGYPKQASMQRNGIAPMSYANYPTSFWIPIKIWIIRNSNGTGGTPLNRIKALMEQLNMDFRVNNTLIQFYMKCQIGYIDNDNYMQLTESKARDLAGNYEDDGAINVFMGNVLANNNAGTYYSSSNPFNSYMAFFISQQVALGTSSLSTMSHEMGHYLGLDHTHQYHDEGPCLREPVSRTRTSNSCGGIGVRILAETTGDGLSDTPADPLLTGNSNCVYSLGGNDHFGDPYNTNPPDVRNIMSYNGDRSCRSTFSRQQVAVMLQTVLSLGFPGFYHTKWSNTNSMFDKFEPDNSADMASLITKCELQDRNFHQEYAGGSTYYPCDDDWVKYTATASEPIDIFTAAVPGQANMDTYLYIYDANQNLLASNDNKAPNDNYSRVRINTSAGSTYYIRIVNMSQYAVSSFYRLGVGTEASAMTISGPSAICYGSNATYTISGLPAGASVVWDRVLEAGYGDIGLVSADNTQATFELWEYGMVRVRATVTAECGSYVVLSEPIALGMPYYITTDVHCEEGCVGGGGYLCTDPSPYDPHNNLYTYQLNATPAFPVTLNCKITDEYSNVIWQNSKTISGQSGYEYLPRNLPVGYLIVAVWLSGGPCNTTSAETFESGVYVQSCGYASKMVAYPNPTNTELKIGYAQNELGKSNEGFKSTVADFSVKLLDKNGKVLREGRTSVNKKDIVLNVASIPNGIYYLHIFEGKKVNKQQIVIFH